ncbi:MAG: tetratricopeptide repeat protein [Acidimicrobiales bacterium]
MGLRVCLAGRVAVEVDGEAVATTGLGPLGCLALAYLVTERSRSVERYELAELLWGDDPPRSWETSLRVLVSKLRALLERAGLPPREALTVQLGCYQLQLPADAVVDVEEADEALTASRSAMAAGRPPEAMRLAAEAIAIGGRQFLPGATGTWVERRQGALREMHLQALEALTAASSSCGEWAKAVQAAETAIALEPLHEQTWVKLMEAHAGAGNRGQALRIYERCRRLLVEELGVSPSPATDAAYVALLVDSGEPPPTGPTPDAPDDGWSLAGLSPLPLPLTTFVGRNDDLAEVAAVVSRSRLVTLTGTGGVGKTRLSLQAARCMAERFPDGTALVELDPLTDPRLVDAQVLAAFGLAEEAGRTPVGTLVARIGGRQVLLVLDNCEHLLSACAVLTEALLSRCSGLHILATSREPLRVPAEATLRVRSLSVPGPGHSESVDALLGYEAVRLLVERAAASSSDFELTDSNASAAARICRELDGIPLALELAAGRTSALSLEDIAKRLDDRFPLLANGSRTAPSRHRTLRGAVDWTYDALSAEQRDAFHRVSVFAGGFTVEAAERLWAAPPHPRVLDLLTDLVQCSVLGAETGLAMTRYRLPETMRQYAATKLRSTGDAEVVRGRHLSWAAELAERAEDGLLQGGQQAEWLEVMDAELDNLRAALAWATAPEVPAVAGLALAAALGRFWEIRGHLREGRRWLAAALGSTSADSATAEAAAAEAGSKPSIRAKALNWSGILAQRQGDSEGAQLLYQDSLAIMRETGDRAGMAAALHGLGNLSALQGEAAARVFFEESLAIGRELGDERTVAASLANLGWVAHNDGDLAAARRLYEESLVLRRELGDRHGVAMLVGNLGHLAFQQGDYATARRLDEESLALRRELGDRHGVAMVLGNLGHLVFQEGDDEKASALYEESLDLRRELGDRHGEAGSLANLATMARVNGDAAGARSLYERALAIARDLGDRYRTAWLLVQLGRVAASDGDLARAEAFYREALPAQSEFRPLATAAEWLEGQAALAVAGVAATPADAERAVRLLAAAAALRQSIGVPVAPRDAPERDRVVDVARLCLDTDAFSAMWSEGMCMSLEEAL